MKVTTISLIACIDKNYGIGKNNRLLYKIKDDLKRFKELTTGHIVIMGRKTYESLPKERRPLPGRINIVITRHQLLAPKLDATNAALDTHLITAHSPAQALKIAEELAKEAQGEARVEAQGEIFIIGGESIYRQFMPLADRLYLTEVKAQQPAFTADTYFPEIDPKIWAVAEEEEHGQCWYRIYTK